MIRINLLPVKAAQKKEKLRGQLFVTFLVLVVTVALCGSVYMYFLNKIQAVQAEIDQKRFEISKLMKTIGEVNQFKKRQKELRAKLDVLEKLETARSGPVRLLDELYKAMPEKLWLTSFSESGGKAKIEGVGVNEETVALFMRNLESSDFYSNVDLQVTQLNVKDGNKFQKFSLVCKTEAKKPDVNVETAKSKKKSGGT
jgi:type IV pilus assembly protein PilN